MTFDAVAPLLLSGLCLAALSAITFVAYRHPIGFRRLADLLLWLSLGIAFAVSAYDLGNVFAFSAVAPFLPPDAYADAQAAVRAQAFGIMPIGLAFAFILYLGFLRFVLPHMVGDTGDNAPDSK